MEFVLAVVATGWRHELRRYLRDRSQRFGAVSRTVLWLLILAVGLGASIRQVGGVSYAQYVLPGVMLLNVMFAALQSAVALVRDRDGGFLREVAASPAPLLAIVLGKLFGGATVATLQGCIPLLLLPLLAPSIPLARVPLGLGVLFLVGFAVTAFGVVIASRLRSLESFGAISNGVIQPLFFLSGAIFPLRAEVAFATGGMTIVALPPLLEALMRLNPVAYLLDVLRLTLYASAQLPLSIGFGMLLLLPLGGFAAAHRALRGMLRGPGIAG
jgi:ABC-2 type transport system permease protein